MLAGSKFAGGAVIANGASVSGALDVRRANLVGFVMPAAWTAAAISLEVSIDEGTPTNWSALQDRLSATYPQIATPVVNVAYALDPVKLQGWNWIRFRSGTTAAPVNQGAARTIATTAIVPG